MDPQTLVNLLVEIAELEELLLGATQKIKHNAELSFTLEELQAEYEVDAAKAARENEGAEVTVRGLENEIRQVAEWLKVKENQVVGLTDSRQVLALTQEIRSLKQRLDRLEDKTIDLLDQQDELKSEAVESRSDSLTHGAGSRAKQEAMARDSADLFQKTKYIQNDLERLLGMLPPSENRAVTRLRQNLDQAVVNHKDGVCLGCFNHLPQQQAIVVEQGRTVVRCPSCMRFIVHRSWR